MRLAKLLGVVIVLSFLLVSLRVPASVQDRPIFEHTGDGQIIFYNTHTDELLEILYKDEEGRYLEKGLRDVNYILRCRLTGKEMDMSLKLLELVDKIQDHFDGKEIEVISGFRSQELNGMLRESGRGVASRSRHLLGEAVDLRIPGVSLEDLRDYVRSLHAGGVGYYPGPEFVHVDVGRVRNW